MIAAQDIYDRAPYWVQAVMLNMHSLRIHRQRYGTPFLAAMNTLRETQWFTPDQIEDHQLTRLQEIVKHAYETVPFYRALYDAHHIHPLDIKNIADFEKLPVITRDDVRRAGTRMISSAFKLRNLVKGNTSGTTGSPLSFYWDKATCVYTAGVDWRQKEWAGVSYGDPIALFLGRPIVPPNRDRPPFWHEDRIHKMLWMSSFHLSEKYLPTYVKKLRQHRPKAIEGYPSTLFIIARYLKEIGETIPVHAVFSSSETLRDDQRELIEERFEARLFDFYGLAERVAFATQCPEAHAYHLNFEYAYNEIVENNDKPAAPEQPGYLVGTSLINFGMPFIRYRTTDITALSEGRCDCGRYGPRLSQVATKDEDILVTPEGKHISPSILTHAFKPLSSVIESQIIQENLRSITVRLVLRPGCGEFDVQPLLRSLRQRLGQSIEINIEYIDKIERTKAGKFRWVISKAPKQGGVSRLD